MLSFQISIELEPKNVTEPEVTIYIEYLDCKKSQNRKTTATAANNLGYTHYIRKSVAQIPFMYIRILYFIV